MEPGVPFALLGAVLLVAVAGWVALAAAGLLGPMARRSRGSGLLLVLGAAVLVATETLTGTRLSDAASDDLLLARAAGLLLVAAALAGGRLLRPPAEGAAAVVVPLGASAGPATVAAAAGLAAVTATVRERRDAAGLLVAAGLLAAAAAAGAAPLAVDSPGGALLVLALRGAAALLLLAGAVVLARRSLLAKVVAAILAGVLAMAAAAVGVVGTTVARGYEREQATLVEDAATGRQQLLRQTADRLRVLAPVLARGCGGGGSALGGCDAFLGALTEETAQDFVLRVPVDGGEPVVLGGRAPLSPTEALGVAGSALVARASAGGAGAPRTPVDDVVRLLGAEPGLAQAVALPGERPSPTEPPDAVFVYGQRLGQALVDRDIGDGGFGYTLLVGDDVVASNLSDNERRAVVEAAESAGSLPEDGTTVGAQGSRPTVHLRPLLGRDGSPVGTMALSREADLALSAQREALSALLLTALGTTALVAGLALLLGRRTVEPVRRLTAAARRVRAGDLDARTGVRTHDEVGTLARAFDEMTGSLSQLTGDLRETATRLETVLASMSDGLLATDGRGAVTSVNRAALAMTGLDADAVLGRPIAEVLDVRAGEAALPLAPGVTRDEPAEVHRPGGATTPVRVAVTPLQEAGDGGLVVVLRDTTREQEVERMKTEFLSNVSHELRTPLTPIRGYADILAARPGLPPEQVVTFAGTILTEALKMNRVVDLLVDVAAIEAGRVTTEPHDVDARALLDERVAAWKQRAPERAGDLRRRVAAGLPAVHVDPVWVRKALDELVDNAVKYTPAGTPLTLVAAPAPDAGRVRLAVRDAGPGVDPDDAELLFTSFEQKDGSATRRVGGLGLGLSFVRRVAQDAGWQLAVTSPVSGGRGAQFALDVPAGAPQAPRRASRAAPRRAPVPGQGRSPARPARRSSP